MNRNLHLSIGILFSIILLGQLLQAPSFSFGQQGLYGPVLEAAAFQIADSWTIEADGDAGLNLPPVFTACLSPRSEAPLLPNAKSQRLTTVSRQSLCAHLSRPPPQALS